MANGEPTVSIYSRTKPAMTPVYMGALGDLQSNPEARPTICAS